MRNRPGQQPEISLDQIFKGIGSYITRVRERLGGGGSSSLLLGILGLLLLLWLATGTYTVDPREQAALRFFGRFTGVAGPGLHWYWPVPIGTRNIEAVTETRRMELGFRATGADAAATAESLMITGDENIVDVQMVVQYKIRDLESYLFKVGDPGEVIRGISPGRPDGRTLKDAAEVAIRQVVGHRAIDDVLTVEKENVQIETQSLLQRLLNDYETGIQVIAVQLQNVRPPRQVQDAFDDVVRGKEDKQRIISLAQAYQQDIIPRARGEAQQIIKAAEAFKAERVAKAEGEAQRFLSILEEYQKAKEVTRQRLYLEAMEAILPGITKFIIASGSGGNLLQFLPLQPGQTLPPPTDGK